MCRWRSPRPAAAAAACLLLLLLLASSCHAKEELRIKELAPGVCPSMDIRSTPDNLSKLRGCEIIEGTLSIVLLERHRSMKQLENMSFPDLREITGYLVVYRVLGLRNLGDLFPNLSVIRGLQLFKDYSLIVFDNANIEALGLRSLTLIERGAVRIQNNDKLCYTDTIDWERIMPDGTENNIIRSNYDARLCGLCPKAQTRLSDHTQADQCPTDNAHKLLCWDERNCQKTCPSKCGDSGCNNKSECCHPSCVGGCVFPNNSSSCFACKYFSFKYRDERKCVEHCPPNTFELNKRCVSELECRKTRVSNDTRLAPVSNIAAYKTLEGRRCVYLCPSKYMEVGNSNNASCVPCPRSGCVKECNGDKIDSIGSAEKFRGCTHIKGTLQIALRASKSNTVAILESSLGEIREIHGCLKVVRSNPLVSLMFLKNLRRIIAVDGIEKGQALHIFNNPNLELLWDWVNHEPIEVKGTLYIHFNPKLCNNQIEPLKNMTKDGAGAALFREVDVSDNGDKATCSQELLNLKLDTSAVTAVILSWNMFCVDDFRNLLGYSLYYIETEKNVTLYGQRDACSDTWNVVDITMDEVNNKTRQDTEGIEGITLLGNANSCKDYQPVFHPLTQLNPYTRYAAYVKAFTTSADKKGALSPIIYFRTLPKQPSAPASLNVEIESPHSISIKWSEPLMPNGTIKIYHVEILANVFNKLEIMEKDTSPCANPNWAAINVRFDSSDSDGRHSPPKQETGKVDREGTCACDDAPPPGKRPRFTAQVDEEAQENILFENELQNIVYIRNSKILESNRTLRWSGWRGAGRVRRSVRDELNSMLVILGKEHVPSPVDPQANCTNATDHEGYVKTLYYEMAGDQRTLSVENLRHYTWYSVYIWACREKVDNETMEYYIEHGCSPKIGHNFRTMELENADTVSNVQASIIPSNKTTADVNMTWEPPRNPNGFVISYSVQYSTIHENLQQEAVGLVLCVKANEFEANGYSYILRNLIAGNYSVQVTPITVRGAGNTSEVNIFIPERTLASTYEWVWAVVGGCVITLLVLFGGFWYVKRGLLSPAEAHKLFASVNPEYVSTVYVPDEWEVPRSSIEFLRELGQGSFGMVYEGIAKNIEKGKPETRCAVKTVNEHATDRERVEFLNEASVMKAFDTFHVVRLLGVVSQGQPTLVIMELMELGDLKTYLRSHRPDADNSIPKKDGNSSPPSLQNILQMAIEIADGMAYLSAKKFVHRDLAARNCMVAGDLTVKVGDFGMTRDIYETDYYRKGTKGLLPVRWMSPESLKDGVFSSNSDVWSYGVVLWEMATLAMQPYQGLSNEQVLRYVVEGGVMERPEHCPDRLYELMRACWSHRPNLRPSFLRLVSELAPSSQPYFRHRSFFHSPQGQDMYLQANTAEEESSGCGVDVGALGSGSGGNLFGVSGRLASWVRELSSLRARSLDAAAEPLQPPRHHITLKSPNGVLRDAEELASTGC